MFSFFKKQTKKPNFDRRVLRKNDISLLILDERWNNLFINAEKPEDIVMCEEKIRQLLKEQSSLTQESKENCASKKKCMETIMKLTPKVYDENDEQSKKEMERCQKEIKRVNVRNSEIEYELDRIFNLIKETNLELLEHTVNMVYFRIRSNQKRVEELEELIKKTRKQLREYIAEKESLAQDDSDIYSYFHDLLGAEELERLDKQYFET